MDDSHGRQSPELNIQTLGAFRVHCAGRIIPDGAWGTHRAKLLFKLLLCESGRPIPRERIMDSLWPDAPAKSASRDLYTAVSELRHVLEPHLLRRAPSDFIISTDEGYRFNLESLHTLDVTSFTQHVASARAQAERGALAEALQSYAQAEALYRGDYLPDDLYADWSSAERERLRSLFLAMQLESAEVAAQLGHFRDAITRCRRALAIDNCLEEAYRALMRYYEATGAHPQALRAYAECEVVLLRELDVSPTRETSALFEAIKRAAEEPGSGPPVTNLPIPLTSFVGRKEEVSELKRLLTPSQPMSRGVEDAVRLLTLTGPGGSGKTRLAIRAANELLDQFGDGVWWIELGGISDGSLVARALAKPLHVRESQAEPLDETLTNALRARHMLLVLDNCEHLVDACAQLAEQLLTHCPQLKILATSREPLGLGGELVWHVPMLSLPAPTQPLQGPPMRYEAIQLFVERSVAVNRHFSLNDQNLAVVLEICRRLDGIPLAIEMAAARTKTLSPEQIARRLDDRFALLTTGNRSALARRQTLRATLDWSYELLAEDERVLLRRLSVFAGGFSLAAAAALAPSGGVLDLLTQLVDKSWIGVENHFAEARYRLLETIRYYASEKLYEAREASSAQQQQLEFLVGWAERVEPELTGPNQAEWSARLELEQENIRAALQVAATNASTHTPLALRLLAAIWRYWYASASTGEGREWQQRWLPQAGDAISAPSLVRARFFYGAGALAYHQGDLAQAFWLMEQSLILARRIADATAITTALNGLGVISTDCADCARAISFLEESLQLSRARDDQLGTAVALNNLGELLLLQGDYPRAEQLLTEGLAIYRALGHASAMSVSMVNLADVQVRLGDYAAARRWATEALSNARALKYKRIIPFGLEVMAAIARAQQQPERAAMLFGAVQVLREATHARLSPAMQAEREQNISVLRADLDEVAFEAAWRRGAQLNLDEILDVALQP